MRETLFYFQFGFGLLCAGGGLYYSAKNGIIGVLGVSRLLEMLQEAKMISQEKVKGWLVYRDFTIKADFVGDTIETIELNLIPEVWILYITEYLRPFFSYWPSDCVCVETDTILPTEYEISIKEKLNFEEIRQSLDKKEKSYEFDKIVNGFLNFQNQCLAIWEDFCEKYQSLTPEQIQEAKKYCGFDSVTVPVVSMADSGSVPSAPMANPGTVSAPISSLVCSELPMAPVADVKVPMVAPAGSVPAFIQGEVVGIQGSVADEKRETSLTEYKKQTGIQKEMLEVMKQIAENTENKPPKPQTRLETLRDTYLSYMQTVNQNAARYLMKEKHNCKYEEIWKIENWGDDWDTVDKEIKRQEISNIRAGVSQARPKRP